MRIVVLVALTLIAAVAPVGRNVAAVVSSQSAEERFWCAMHPDVRSAAAGVCPICGMPLVRIPPARYVTYPVDLRATPTVRGVRLRLAVRHPVTHALVRQFSVVHERPLHLFVVGDRLQFFAHEHPAVQPDGVFMLDLALPRPGPYMAIAEFVPQGGSAQVFQQLFSTGTALDLGPPPAADVAPKVIDGMRVIVDTSTLRSGSASPLALRVEDAATGAEITDLEPYLGARAHLLIVSTDLTEAIHGHPEDGPGSGIAFAPVLPRPGVYKLWVQIQRAGHVTTVPFVVDVP